MRYVVLHHTGVDQPHYDLMFESTPGSLLMTWRATDWPLAAGDELTRIGDHRREYLEYEGPVSNDLGHIHRVVSGPCDVALSSAQVTIRSAGPDATLIILRCVELDRWQVVEIDG